MSILWGSNLNKYTYLSILILVQIVSSEYSEEVLRLLVRIIDRGSYFIAHMAMLAFEGGWDVSLKRYAERKLMVARRELIGRQQYIGVVQVLFLIGDILSWNGQNHFKIKHHKSRKTQ